MLYNELIESVTEFYENESDTFIEGANADISVKAKKSIKEIRTSIKEAKSLYNDEQYDEAINKLDDVLKNINIIRAEIDAIDITLGNSIIGFFYQLICSGFKASAMALLTFGIHGAGAGISVLKDIIDIISGIIDSLENDGISEKVLNIRRDKMMGMIARFEKYVKKLQKEIKNVQSEKMKKEEEEKKEEEKKEEKPSVESVKLSIFESCHAGEITEEERDTLLSIL